VTERNVFEDALLGFLYEGPRHGYDLSLHFADGGDLAAVGRLGKSQLYALLKGLEKRGLARGALTEGEGGPARRVFELTDRGRERFRRWVDRPVDSVRGLRVEFLLKLYFLSRLGLSGQADLMDAQAEVLARRVAQLQAAREVDRGIGPWVRALQERLLEAGLRWLAEWRDKVPRQAAVGRQAAPEPAAPQPNRFPGRVLATEVEGGVARVDLELEGGVLAALLPREALAALGLSPGDDVTVLVPPGAVVLTEAEGAAQ
jgi:molybdopterin-binding protein